MAKMAPVQPDTGQRISSDTTSWPFLYITLGALAWFVIAILVPHLKSAFVADDHVFLIEDADRPWYSSGDFLYRPFRNLLAHVLPRLIGMAPIGYRLLVIFGVLATLVVFFLLLRELGLSRNSSLAGVLIAAFYPRHAIVYYFWAASQDAFMALLLIASFVCWIRYRKRDRDLDYWLALILFALGLGFKEPAGCFPALILGWDVFRLGREWRKMFQPAFWRPYLGFLPILAAYGAFVVWYPQGRFHQPRDPYGVYGFFGLGKVAFAWIRTWINLIFPFGSPIGLHGLRAFHILILGLIVAALVALQFWLRLGPGILLCVAAIGLLNLPTSAFASVSPGDQYLYLPSFVFAGFLGYVAGVVLDRKPMPARIATLAVLLVYVVFSTIYLKRQQTEWQQAGQLTERVIGEIRGAVTPVGLRELTLIGPPHSYKRTTVFNNGMLGSLIDAGYSRDLHVLLTHADTFPPDAGQQLIERALACRMPAGKPQAVRVLVVTPEYLAELDPACAQPIVAADRKTRFWAWSSYPDH